MFKVYILLFAAMMAVSCKSKTADNKVPGDAKTTTVSTEVKVHTCTAACKDNNHLFQHNEIGHTCSSDCGRPHVCSDKCKGQTHVYAHGEVGHYCMCTPAS